MDRKEVVKKCLNCFVQNGLTQTTTKELSSALNLQNGGVYYYFDTKTEIVISCAEEAVREIENKISDLAFENIEDIENMVKILEELSEELSPIMRFLVSVCVSNEYSNLVKPTLVNLADRYIIYSEKVAKALKCDLDEVKPFVYMAILALNNYMIFSEKALFEPQIALVKKALLNINKKEI